MSKTALIIRREYLTRVRKKSFIIMTILGPLIMGGLIGAVVFLSAVDKEVRRIAVVDDSGMFDNKFKNDENTQFTYLHVPVDSLRKKSREGDFFGILYIPASEKMESVEEGVTIYSEKQPSFVLIEKIRFTMEKEINRSKYLENGIDPKKLESIKTNVTIKTKDLFNNETSTPITTIVGFAGGLLIYLFTLLYGVQVMRGVMEEKISRIVEVIISSVKPMQLMMGKIIGVALVGLTQFLLWVILTSIIYGGVMSVALKETPQSKIEQAINIQGNQDQAGPAESKSAQALFDAVSQVNFPLLLGCFIFYFLGGYLLYAALFAAIGSAVDSETDTQQFMLPVTIPLILAYVASANVIQNPDSTVGFWFSMIPFTSPIVMMVRIPFGVPWYEVAGSMALLVLGFLFTTWLAARIYRTGILMYGKKVSYREIGKWLLYRS